jgi:hypothetical protein
LPWALIATADAYERGGWSDKARALEWMEGIVREGESLEVEALAQPWVAAEVLISLRRVEGRKAI